MTSKCKECGSRWSAAVHKTSSDRYDHEWVCGDCGHTWRGHNHEGRCGV